MRKLKATICWPGVDIYFIPDNWKTVHEVYLVPISLGQNIRSTFRKEDVKKYKVDFILLPPDKEDKQNPLHRRIKLKSVPQLEYALVSDAEFMDTN